MLHCAHRVRVWLCELHSFNCAEFLPSHGVPFERFSFSYAPPLHPQDAQEKARSMPWWIFLIIAVLGWNEFIAILSHPIGLAILLLLVAVS